MFLFASFKIPVGTVISNSDTDEILADLVTDGERFVVATGGEKGLGNVHFKSPTMVRPKIFTEGGVGQVQHRAAGKEHCVSAPENSGSFSGSWVQGHPQLLYGKCTSETDETG